MIIPMMGKMTMHTEKHSYGTRLIVSLALVYPTYFPSAGLRQCLPVHKTHNADLADVEYTIKKQKYSVSSNTRNNDQL